MNAREVKGLYPIDGIDASLSHTDLAPLEQMLDEAQLVGLGESIHTSGGYYQAKFRLFRYLVEQLGFRALAIESPWEYAQWTREYAAGLHADKKRAMRGIFTVWRAKAVGDLLDWIRAYNESNPDDPVCVYGYDIQQPWCDYPALEEFLAEAVPERHQTLLAGLETNIAFDASSDGDFYSSEFSKRMYDHEAGPEVLQRYRQCDEGLKAIEALFADERDELIEATSEKDFLMAELRLVGLRAWMDAAYYHFGREEPALGNEARDRGMAFAVRRLRRFRCPGARTAVWAHNMHLTKANHRIGGESDDSTRPGGRSMGTFLAEHFGTAYRAIALVGRYVETNWSCVDNDARKPVTDPDAVETILAEYDEPYLLYDAHRGELFSSDQTYRLGHWNRLVVPRQFDALFFLDHSSPMTPLDVR